MIYTEMFHYLTDMFKCPVIIGLQNNSPLPKDCIVMTIMPYIEDLVKPTYFHKGDEGMIQSFKNYFMQLDFYGSSAFDRALQVSTLWRSIYTTERLKAIQPLYCKELRHIQHVNEQQQYEPRFLLEVALQYNPHYKFEVGDSNNANLEIEAVQP